MCFERVRSMIFPGTEVIGLQFSGLSPFEDGCNKCFSPVIRDLLQSPQPVEDGRKWLSRTLARSLSILGCSFLGPTALEELSSLRSPWLYSHSPQLLLPESSL